MSKVFEKSWVEELKRRYGSMSKYTRPYVAFMALDPRASEERDRIEEWFQTLPDNTKPDIMGRLRDKNEQQHFGAYYELVIRHYFHIRDYTVTVNPKLKEGEPDLLVEGNVLETPVLVEVATVFDDPDWQKEGRKLNSILAQLEQIRHHFFVVVSIRSRDIPERVDYKKLRRFIEEWLDSFDQQVNQTTQATIYREGGLEIELTLIPERITKKVPIIGGYMLPARYFSAIQLRRAIEKKIHKYGSIKEQNMPYIVAVCLHKDALVDNEAILEVLFGKEVVTADMTKKEMVGVTRDFSGLLTSKPGLGGLVQNTRLSALLVVSSRWLQPKANEKECEAHYLRVLHNPNAAIPLGLDLFAGYPQFVKVAEDEKNFSLDWIDKESQDAFHC